MGTRLAFGLLALACGLGTGAAEEVPSPPVLKGTLPEGGSVRWRDVTVEGGRFGNFELVGIPGGERFDLEILPPKETPGTAPIVLRDLEMPPSGGNFGSFRWRPGRPVVLRVTAPLGAPLEGAGVGIYWGGYSYGWMPGTFPLEKPRRASMEALTNEIGIVRFDRLPPGPWVAQVTMPGRRTFTVDLREHMAGQDPEMRVVLQEACSLRGTVRDHRGRPLAGVVVVEGQAISFPIHCPRTVTDESGRYFLEGLRPGAAHISVIRGTDRHSEAAVFTIPGVRSADLEIGGDAVVRGRVVDDADGRPVPGVVLRFSVSREGELATHVVAESGPDGRFSVAGLESDHLVRSFTAQREGYFKLDAYGIPKPDPTGEFLIRMFKRVLDGTVRGWVVGPWGIPVPGVRVRMHQPALSPYFRSAETYTGANGAFRMEARSGEAALHIDIEEDGYLRAGILGGRRDSNVITVPAGGTATVGLCLVPAGTIRGILVDPDGNPVPGVRVRGVRWFGRTDDRGRFEVRGVTPGVPESLRVDDRGWWGSAGPFLVGSGQTLEGTRIVALPPVELRGVALDREGKPIGGTALLVLGRWVATGPDGSFTTRILRLNRSSMGGPGREQEGKDRELPPFTVDVGAAGYAPAAVTLSHLTTDTRVEEFAVTLTPGRDLEGFVSRKDGWPLPGVRVRLRERSRGYRPTEAWNLREPVVAVTADDGAFTVRHLSEGTWEVLLQARDYVDKTLIVGPRERADAVLELDLR